MNSASQAPRPTQPSPDAEAYREAGLWTRETLAAPLRAGAERHPERLALVDGDRRFTYAELWSEVRRAAGMLVERGIGPGDVVSFQLPNRAEAVIVHHATALVGGVSNPIIPIYREHELSFILRQAASRILIVPDVFRGFDHRPMAAWLQAECEALEHVIVVGEAPAGMESLADAMADVAPLSPPVFQRAEDIVLLLYTSGTEASPKGVLHSHETLTYECRSIIDLYRLGEGEKVFMASPLGHITGVLYAMSLPFMLGTAVVLQDVWEVSAAIELIEREGCTFTVGATPFLHGMVSAERPVTSLSLFICGGADIPPALIYEAETRLGMRATRVYGSTECPIVAGTPPAEPSDRHAETDGRPIAPTGLRIADADGEVLPAGERGELQVRGPDAFLGYLDPALNDDAFTADGWFRTGDLAAIGADGYLTLSGRAKDIILRGGENLSAKEVEDLLFEHPAVTDVAIVGYPDPVMGERACAVVVADSDLDLAGVVDFLRGRRIATQKLPERLLLVDELPKTASGKVQKYVLRERLTAEAR